MNFENLSRFMDGFLAMGIPGYDCMVMYKGEVVYRRYNGFSDLAARIPVNGKERSHIFSCSKPITCAAALQLWEKGLYKLDDALSDYMPEFTCMKVRGADGSISPAKNKITVRNLFTMTAGLDYNTLSPELRRAFDDTQGRCPTREVMKYLAESPLQAEPGSVWQYSLCHDVLAAFVEVLSGETFEEYVKKHIFDPLGMKDSTFLVSFSDHKGVSPLYRRDATSNALCRLGEKEAFLHNLRLGTQYASGGAGCVSTVEDYMLFLEAMRKGDVILKNSTIDMMTTPQLTPEQDATFWLTGDYHYGLGIRCPREGGNTDSGWGGAAGAYLAFDRVNDLTIYYAQNVLNSPNNLLRREIVDYAMAGLKA